MICWTKIVGEISLKNHWDNFRNPYYHFQRRFSPKNKNILFFMEIFLQEKFLPERNGNSRFKLALLELRTSGPIFPRFKSSRCFSFFVQLPAFYKSLERDSFIAIRSIFVYTLCNAPTAVTLHYYTLSHF